MLVFLFFRGRWGFMFFKFLLGLMFLILKVRFLVSMLEMLGLYYSLFFLFYLFIFYFSGFICFFRRDSKSLFIFSRGGCFEGFFGICVDWWVRVCFGVGFGVGRFGLNFNFVVFNWVILGKWFIIWILVFFL